MAPEMYQENYGKEVDIYAFGMAVLEMLTGQYPYEEVRSPVQIYRMVSKGIKPACLRLIEDQPIRENFVMRCICTKAEDRYVWPSSSGETVLDPVAEDGLLLYLTAVILLSSSWSPSAFVNLLP